MKPLRIVIDGRMLYWTGVGRYTTRLLTNLEKLDRTNHYFVLLRQADWDSWTPTAPNFTKVLADINPYTLAEQTKLVGIIRSLRPDVVHFLAPNAPILYPGARITTVHDLTLLDYDTSRGTGMRRRIRGLKRIPFRMVLARSIHASALVLAVTNYVGRQVVDRLGGRAEQVRVTKNGSEPDFAKPESIDKLDLPREFLLYWGNYYPYKNVATTIQALAALSASRPELGLVLGGNPDAYGHDLKALARSLGVEDRVKFVGFVPDGQLVSLCRAAKLFVFPSLSEGFGLPGLEAMAQGLPVLAANASCLPEVYGSAAAYFNPKDVADQARQIARLLGDPELLKTMSSDGKHKVREYSWEHTAEQTLAAYQEVGAKLVKKR